MKVVEGSLEEPFRVLSELKKKKEFIDIRDLGPK